MNSGRRSGGVKKSSSGQAPLLAGILFLLLIPTTIIIAENATSNLTGNMAANFSLENATSGALPINETNQTGNTESGAPLLNDTSLTLPQVNETENTTIPGNATNITPPGKITIPEENTTINITPAFNETNMTLPGNTTNTTTPENETAQEPANETQEPKEPELQGPVLEVNLNVPNRANRNEPFTVSAEINNTGDTDALGVEVEWVLPEDFSILSGSGSHYCDVPSEDAYLSELEVAAPLSSMLGEQEIKVLVRYGG
jgi:hypothetical protein